MAITVAGTTITFNDGTVQSTAASAVTTTSVLNATAGASVGAVGSYAFLRATGGESALTTLIPGGTRAGSTLRYTGATQQTHSTVPAGTWRCLGLGYYTYDSYGLQYGPNGTVWLRIS